MTHSFPVACSHHEREPVAYRKRSLFFATPPRDQRADDVESAERIRKRSAAADERNDFDHVAGVQHMLRMLSARNDLPVDLGREITGVETTLFQQIAHGSPLNQFLRFAIENDMHDKA